ncbi:MAG: hypothetical protein ABIO79_01955 [Ferruginibacter sp.]
MKKVVIVLMLLSGTYISKAQDEENRSEEKRGGFKKENLFTGGGLTVSFSNYTTVLGASPVLGYSITKWLDAGIVINFNYGSNRHVTYLVRDPGNPADPGYYITSDDKLRQTVFGPGAFVRIYPVNFLFVQAQAEQNFINQKIIYDNGAPSTKTSVSATSILVGAGYCVGRAGTGSLFYYVSIMADIAKNRNSPYVEELASGRINVLPIIRAGLQIPLFQGKSRRR